ncbi:MAG: hypothetical protein IPH61_12140 [Bacteroidetes bacterium]|nr:hypothetical protein [Bacteroidota bacterium]
MLRVDSKKFSKHVTCSENEIILSGPPDELAGYITLNNAMDESVFIKDIALHSTDKSEKNRKASVPNMQNRIQINTALLPQSKKSFEMLHQLDSTTPPGNYEMMMEIGGELKKAKLIVHENLDIQFTPDHLTLSGINAGAVHTREINFVNQGNIPVTIPNIRHNTMLDMDIICRNLSNAVREKGTEGTEATLDSFVNGIKKDMADWVKISIKEAGEVIEPGKNILLHVQIELPKDLQEQRFYEGEIRIFNQLLKYQIVQNTAPRINKIQKANYEKQ